MTINTFYRFSVWRPLAVRAATWHGRDQDKAALTEELRQVVRRLQTE